VFLSVTLLVRPREKSSTSSLSACNKTSPCTILVSGPLKPKEFLWPLPLFPMRYGV
jgi:hypothetical protein